MFRSCDSLRGATFLAEAAAIIVFCGAPTFAEFVAPAPTFAGVAGAPATLGPVCTALLAGGGRIGFGEKNFAHSKITPIDSSDAASSRISCPNFVFFSGSLKNGPLGE
jgi:hypothetical protein